MQISSLPVGCDFVGRFCETLIRLKGRLAQTPYKQTSEIFTRGRR
jgi:hypothetical protein